MSSFKYYIFFSLCILSSLSCYSQKKSKAQQKKEESIAMAKIQATINTDSTSNISVFGGDFKLPPLSVLYENARNNPEITVLEKEKQLQKKLLTKEKKSWLRYFNAQGSYSYGIADVYSNQSNQLTPMLYQYAGSRQNFWNIGGNVSFPIEELFDQKGKVSRQKIAVEKAELNKEQAFDQLKQQIIHLYVTIESNINALKASAQHLALYKGVSANAEEEYRNRRTTIEVIANAKKMESDATLEFESLNATIKEQILVLEILSRTPILTNK